MARIPMISFVLAAGIVVLTSQSNAQSPDPALPKPASWKMLVGSLHLMVRIQPAQRFYFALTGPERRLHTTLSFVYDYKVSRVQLSAPVLPLVRSLGESGRG